MKIKALQTYKDLRLDRIVLKGEVILANNERAKELIDKGYAEKVNKGGDLTWNYQSETTESNELT